MLKIILMTWEKGIAVITKPEDFEVAAQHLWGATLDELKRAASQHSLYEPMVFRSDRVKLANA